MFFNRWDMFWNISRVYFFFFLFNIENVKSNCKIIFLKSFLVFYFWRIFYSIPIIFFYKKLSLCGSLLISLWITATIAAYRKHLSSLIFVFTVAFFLLYPVWRINIWSSAFEIYLLTFIIQKLNWIKNKITSSHWCF